MTRGNCVGRSVMKAHHGKSLSIVIYGVSKKARASYYPYITGLARMRVFIKVTIKQGIRNAEARSKETNLYR